MSQVIDVQIVLVIAEGAEGGELRILGASEAAILQAMPGIVILAGQHVDTVAIPSDCYGEEEGYARFEQLLSWRIAQERRYQATWIGVVPAWLPW